MGRALDFNRDEARQLLDRWAADTPGVECISVGPKSHPVALFDDDRIAVAVKHPFEAADEDLEAPRIRAVRSEIEATGRDIESVVFVDGFLMERVPSMVTARLGEFAD